MNNILNYQLLQLQMITPVQSERCLMIFGEHGIVQDLKGELVLTPFLLKIPQTASLPFHRSRREVWE